MFWIAFASMLMPLILISAVQATETESLKQLKAIIEHQQKQLEAQQQAIEELKRKVDELAKEAPLQTTPPEIAPESARVVKSEDDKVSVTLYGHINRALLVSNDGDETNYYNVDGGHSQSRMGLRAEAAVNEHLDIGTTIELGLKSNLSSEVDQTDKSTDFDINDRIIEVFLDDERFGRLFMGQGHTASDGTSEVDLSGTPIAGYSDIPGMAGGQFFYDKQTGSLSTTRIKNVFNNMDGLGRQDRIRYDTPNFSGFQASGSINNDDGGDIALRYSAKFGETQVAAAGAWASPEDQIPTVDKQYNGSASVLFGMGLNFTVAGGYQDLKGTRSGDEASFIYGKVGYRQDFFSFGETAFSVDFSRSEDIDQNGDEADAFGFQCVQDLDPWGSEWYLGYRYHTLDRRNQSYDDINSFMSGFRVKF
jgi:predicted porin